MDRSTASLVATDAATRVKAAIGAVRWERHPLVQWRQTIDKQVDLLKEACAIFPDDTSEEIVHDFYSPLRSAQLHLYFSIAQKRINKKHVIHALDILTRILTSSRQAIATT